MRPCLVVVGGGVVGLAVAWQASRAGWDVTRVDPTPAGGASWVAAGMLTPAGEATEGEGPLARLGAVSAARYPSFVAELEAEGGPAGYSRQGTLVVARDADDLGWLAELADLQARLGLPAERVGSRQARRLEPALGPTVRGALWLEGDHQVDNRQLLGALRRAGERRGVRQEAVEATEVRSGGGHHEVCLADGRTVGADDVVVAAGARSGGPLRVRVGGDPVTLPLRPVKGQILRLAATDTAVVPTRTVRGAEVYVVPRPHGEVVVGATAEERGHDTSVTAGAVRELLDRAWELVPGLAEARFVEAAAGSRPGTPDNAPLLGRWPDGPVIATGHHRNGILLAPVTADVVVDLLADRAPGPGLVADVDLARFAPARFRVAPSTGTAGGPAAEEAACA